MWISKCVNPHDVQCRVQNVIPKCKGRPAVMQLYWVNFNCNSRWCIVHVPSTLQGILHWGKFRNHIAAVFSIQGLGESEVWSWVWVQKFGLKGPYHKNPKNKFCVSMSWVGLNKSRVSRYGGMEGGTPNPSDPCPPMEACPPPIKKILSPPNQALGPPPYHKRICVLFLLIYKTYHKYYIFCQFFII